MTDLGELETLGGSGPTSAAFAQEPVVTSAEAQEDSGGLPILESEPPAPDLSPEEEAERTAQAKACKERGNTLFREGDWLAALDAYSEAVELGAGCSSELRAACFGNRAACQWKLGNAEACEADCSAALALKSAYPKVQLRRAHARERLERYDEAQADFAAVAAADPSNMEAAEACKRLPKLVEAQQEKMKGEMMDSLKSLGNMCLKPFGLSTDNFKFVKDETTGGYSMNFTQG